jgi:hypothetical protein
MSENFSIRMTFTGSNHPNKFNDLNDGIWRQLMQLHLKFAKNIQKDRVRRYAKASGEEIFEHNCFIFLGIQNKLYDRRMSKTIQKNEWNSQELRFKPS